MLHYTHFCVVLRSRAHVSHDRSRCIDSQGLIDLFLIIITSWEKGFREICSLIFEHPNRKIAHFGQEGVYILQMNLWQCAHKRLTDLNEQDVPLKSMLVSSRHMNMNHCTLPRRRCTVPTLCWQTSWLTTVPDWRRRYWLRLVHPWCVAYFNAGPFLYYRLDPGNCCHLCIDKVGNTCC